MIALAWGIAAGFLVLAAALRLAGASLVRTPRADALHDAADGIAGAKVVAELLEDRARIQPSISLIHSALLVPAALAAAWAPATLFGGWMLVLSLILSGGAIVIIGEWLPRSLGRKHPRRIAYRFAHLLKGSIGAGERAVDLIYDEEEDENNQKGEANGDHDVSDREEIRMISSVLEFSDAIVREVMVPRTDMMMLSADRTTNEALNLIIEHGYSRIPITGRGADDIVGMVYAKDLLHLVGHPSADTPLVEVCRPAHFVPETKPVRDLLREMQSSQVHIAVVVDEFGGTAGLVTIEDLIEELVGEIVDEYDTEPSKVQPLDEGGFLVDARLPVDDLANLLDTDLPEGEWDTVGGLVLGLAGRVPYLGERFELDRVVLIPDRVQGRRVERVRVNLRVATGP